MSFSIEDPVYSVFDVETKPGFTVGPYETEASALTIIRTDQPNRLLFFDEDEIGEGVEWLLSTPRLCSFNGRRFDVPVLLKYVARSGGRKLRDMPHFDIYDEWVRQYPGRIGLKNFAKYTLRKDKFPLQGTTAAGLWRRAERDLLLQYNYWDTYLTYQLLLHVLQTGFLYFKLPVLRKFYPETISRT